MKRNENNLRDLQDNIKCYNIRIIGVPEEEDKKKDHEKILEEIIVERSAVNLMGVPLCVICCFSLAAFSICSLCLIFVNLINMCPGVFCLGFILFATLWVSWTWVIISFPILGKFSTIISSSIFSWSFFLSSSSGTPMIRML